MIEFLQTHRESVHVVTVAALLAAVVLTTAWGFLRRAADARQARNLAASRARFTQMARDAQDAEAARWTPVLRPAGRP